MDLNLSVFQEPRGVMRIFQFIFAICAFATTTGFEGFIDFFCKQTTRFTYDYPFNLYWQREMEIDTSTCRPRVTISSDFSSDATFFVTTGVLSMLYTIAIVVVYTKFDELYRKNTKIPLLDFALTVVFAILWLASSAAWANGLSGLKHVTDVNNIQWDNVSQNCSTCPVEIGTFTTLNISVIFGFLNFVLWAADLWFLYKETIWFQRPQDVSSNGM